MLVRFGTRVRVSHNTVQEWPHAVIRAEPILTVKDRTSAQSVCRWVGFEPITYNMGSAFPSFGLWEARSGSLQKQFPRKTQNICFGFRILFPVGML
jgi:hypothetical protein